MEDWNRICYFYLNTSFVIYRFVFDLTWICCVLFGTASRDKEMFKIQNFWPTLFTLFSLVEKNCSTFLEEGETGTKITDTKDFSSTLVCTPKTEFVLLFLQSFSYINNSISYGKIQMKVVSWPTSPISAQPIKSSAVMITLYSVVQQITYRIYDSSNKYLLSTTIRESQCLTNNTKGYKKLFLLQIRVFEPNEILKSYKLRSWNF